VLVVGPWRRRGRPGPVDEGCQLSHAKDGQKGGKERKRKTHQLPQLHSLVAQPLRLHPEQVRVESSDLVDGPECSSGDLDPQLPPECLTPEVLRMDVGEPGTTSLVVEGLSYGVSRLHSPAVVETGLNAFREDMGAGGVFEEGEGGAEGHGEEVESVTESTESVGSACLRVWREKSER
jgi:hypothetical protein